MENILTWIFIGALWLSLLLNLVNLPGNWLIIGLIALWDWLSPSAHAGWFFWCLVIGLGIGGEALENYLQILKGRRSGASKRGMVAGFVGGIVGSILFAPLFFGLGAILGAFLGAWGGCLLEETLSGAPFKQAAKAALGTLTGRMLGTLSKLGTGAAIIFLAIHAFIQ